MYFKGNHAENSIFYDLSGNETHSSLRVSVFVRVVIQDSQLEISAAGLQSS